MEGAPQKAIQEQAPLAERVEKAYAMAIGQHDVLKRMPPEELKPFIEEILMEIEGLETIGERDRLPSTALSAEIASSIGAIWCFSGPGTYDQPVKEDRYKNYSWASGMDRSRLNYTAQLARRVSESVRGESFRGPLGSIGEIKEKTKEAMKESSPVIFYNGAPVENETVRNVLAREGTVIPAEVVSVIGQGIENTVDQIKMFSLPAGALKEGKKLALVSHAPHLARIVRMLNKYKPLPEGTEVMLFPLPTREEGKEEYARMEVAGILYYVYVSANHDATKEPYPYSVNTGATP